jgi:hypothetical protein
MTFQDVVDAVEEVLRDYEIPIGVRELILDDVHGRLADNLEEDK